jgi:hypothetical protein
MAVLYVEFSSKGNISTLASAAPWPRVSAKTKDVHKANPAHSKAYEAPQRTCCLKCGRSAPLIQAPQI